MSNAVAAKICKLQSNVTFRAETTMERPILKKDTDLKFPHVLLISASAGSGKTHTLSLRYIQLLLSDKIPFNKIENILAVTFTNNAAKEMKQRILDWLKKLALGKDCPELKQTLEIVNLSKSEIRNKSHKIIDEILDNYLDFHIQTIDSFMARVMSCSVGELGLPLGIEITTSYSGLIDAALYSMFSRMGRSGLPTPTSRRDSHWDGFRLPADLSAKALAQAGKECPGMEINEKEIEKFLQLLPVTRSFPWNPMREIRQNFLEFLVEEGKINADICVHNLEKNERLKNHLSAEILKTSMRILEKIPDKVKDRARESIKSGNVYQILEDYKPHSGILHAGKMKNYVPEHGIAENLKRLEKLIVQFVHAVSVSYYSPYINVYLKFKKYLETVKIAKSETIHIDDVNKKLAGYMERNVVPTIYFKLGEKIVHFLIDEFQDTNRLQWLNIRPLVEESLAKKGSLFIVGDIKQAIYMFRNADYRIIKDFLNLAEGKSRRAGCISLESTGNRIEFSTLNINRRSDGMILKYVDDLFKNKLKNATNIIGNDITELTSFQQEILKGRKDAGYVKTEIIENAGEDEIEPKEKAKLIEIIKDVRKRYNLNQIVILVPKNKKIEPIVRWLTKEGIEMASASSLDIRNRKVISEILSLLKFLDSPVDNLSFAGFISGDVFLRAAGIKKEGIYQLMFEKNTNPKTRGEYLYQCFRNNPEFAQTWQNYFEEIYKKVGFLSLYEIVALTFEKFEVLKNFPDEAAFLVRFLEVVGLLQAKGINNVRDFIEFAQEDDEEANQIFSVILPEYVNAVRIMTFHKAKGLGFPVVINMIYDERGESNPMYFHESSSGVIQVYYIKNDFAEKSNDLNEIYTLKKSDENVQNLNVLYVITTRARNEMYNLIIKRVRKKLVKTLPEKLTDIFEDAEIGKPAQESEKEIKVALTTHISVFGEHFAEFESPAKWSIQRHLESKEGELYHRVLSKLEYLSEEPDTLIEKTIEETFNKPDFQFDRNGIKSTLMDFLKIKEVKEWFFKKEGRIVKTEVEFYDKKEGLLRMDRVIIDREDISVIDFKTGQEEISKYESQIKKYMEVIKEIYPEKRVKGFLAYIDLKKIGVVA